MSSILDIVFPLCLIIMALCIIGSLIYAALGKRFTDKVVAVNFVGTLTINIICVLATIWQQDFLLDIALLFSLLSMLDVLILCRVVVIRHKGRLRHLKEEYSEETPQQALDRLEQEEREGHFN